MGGEGSGRRKQTETVAELLMNDDDFRNSIVLKTVGDYANVVAMLMGIIRGEEKEYVFDAKAQELVSRPAPLDVRVKAAKVWKEMTLDKVISDKKVVDNKLQGDLFDIPKMVSEVDALLKALKEKQDGEPTKLAMTSETERH